MEPPTFEPAEPWVRNAIDAFVLARLQAELVAGKGFLQEGGLPLKRVSVGEGRVSSGAKFVRP